MSNIRTVSDTKRAFYSAHTRPISSIYRRVVEELMVEMHLLSVNVEFRYDPVYALGVVTTFDRFMQGYRPEEDLSSIFAALCKSVEVTDANKYRDDTTQLTQELSQLSITDLQTILDNTGTANATGLQSTFNTIAQASSFKYSRLFAIGLLTIVELVDESLLDNETQLSDWLGKLCEVLNLPSSKVEKDVEIYRSNLNKLRQAQEVLADVLKADRKKQMERTATANEDSDLGDVTNTEEEETEPDGKSINSSSPEA